MTPPDAFDYEFDQEFGDPSNATCKFCGKTGLEWVHTGERWRLADGRGIHRCSTAGLQRASLDDFDVLG